MDTITNTSRITSSLKLEIEDPNQTNKVGGGPILGFGKQSCDCCTTKNMTGNDQEKVE